MKSLKIQLLVGTVCFGALPVAAQAQVVYPAAELRGAGASSIQNILVQSLNCVGNPGSHRRNNTANLNQLGTNAGALSSVAEGKFIQTSPTAASPDYNCDTQEIQPNFQGKYVATGSGTGRAFWRLFSNQLPGTTSSNINPFGVWNNVQYAFTDAPVSATDLAAYDANANSSVNKAGAPIQFPLYVLPVALAYNPVYARYTSPTKGLISLTFNVNPTFVTTDSSGNPTGGIRMSKNTYCKIFNGYITNWNDKALGASGVGKTLQDPNDNAARWRRDGVKIRLVGRIDNSGTTDIFTRHLAAACTGQTGVAVNKFATNAEALPYDATSTIDLRAFRTDTRYFPGTTGALAGTVQSLSGAVFVKASGSTPANINTTQGAEALGKFIVADGSSGVRDAINFQPDPGTASGQIALNGKLGYIGSDFVKPATGAALFSAALQVATGARYAGPTSTEAVAAFGNTRYLPPQTQSVTGVYSVNDKRTGPRRDGAAGTVPIDRANPLHWTSVLYSNASDTLANPGSGYPITGTTQFLGYTCYATAANRLAITEFLSLYAGKVTKNSAGQPVSTNLFKGTSTGALGLLAQLNLAPMPDSWLNAISETFLKKSTEVGGTLGAKNLWIQSTLPTTNVNQATSNPTCTTGAGA